jgi:hypothetical protein
LLPCALFTLCIALAGCSGSGSNNGTVPDDQFAQNNDGNGGSIPSGNGSVLSYTMTLNTIAASGTGSTVAPNSTVVATVVLKDSSGRAVANQPIKFEAVEGPVIIETATVSTDSNGTAINFLKAGGSTTSAEDVIIQASSTISGQTVSSLSIFKILRSEGNVIRFTTTKNPTDPDGTLNTLSASVKNASVSDPPRTILQLVPFNILDSNGFPRTRVPVNISIYSQIGDCPVFIDSPETAAKTVTTDDTGLGIFNAGVTIAIPPPGSENACSIIYKAEAANPENPSTTIYSYGGFIAVLKNESQ